MRYHLQQRLNLVATLCLTTALALFGVSVYAEDANVIARAVHTVDTFDAPLKVRLTTQFDDASIIGHDANTVIVEVMGSRSRKSISSNDLSFGSRKNEISIRVGSRWENHDLRVFIPESASLLVKTTDSDVSVSGLSGELDLNCVDGDIVLTNVTGPVVANTVDGDIEANVLASDQWHRLSLATYDGDIDLTLPNAVKADLAVSTIDGKFDTSFPLNQNGNDSIFKLGSSMSVIKGTINGGGPRIQIKTVDGDVRIKKRNP